MHRLHWFSLGLAGITLPVLTACGNTKSRPPDDATYRLAEARIWLGERHVQALCSGDFFLTSTTDASGIKLSPKGNSTCEGGSVPTLQARWGGACDLAPVTFDGRQGRLYVASEPRFACDQDPSASTLLLEAHQQGFSLVARGERGLVAEYFFERQP
jgi:hypothetical protein